jgi:DNA-binding transcriptional MerR regulator
MYSESNIPTHQEVEQIAKTLGISKSLIRFWEEEFALADRSNGTMSPREVAEIHLIHSLILEKELTLEDAKEEFSEKRSKIAEKYELIERLENIRNGLLALQDKLGA